MPSSITFVPKKTTVPADWLQALNDLLFNALDGATTKSGVQAALGIASSLTISPFSTALLEQATATNWRTVLGVPSTAGDGATGNWNINAASISTILSLDKGGTGSSTAAGARTVLGVPDLVGTGTSGNWPINSVSITTTLPINKGGTGAITAADARTALGVPSLTGAGASGNWNINAATASNGGVTSVTVDGGAPQTGNVIVNTGGGGGGGGGLQSVGLDLSALGFSVTGSPVTGAGGTITASASGSLPIARGGTAASTAADARVSLGVPSTAGVGAFGNWPINSVSITSILPLSLGGTGGTTASEARTNLGVPSLTGVGATGNWNINASSITSVLPVVLGGTGATNAPDVRNALGVPSLTGAGATGDWPVNSVSITTILPISKGGTGAVSDVQARTNLGVPSLTGVGASGNWNINAATATSAANGGVTSVTINGSTQTGATSFSIPAGVPSINGVTTAATFVGAPDVQGTEGNGSIEIIPSGGTFTIRRRLKLGGGNSSIHPDSEILMADGSIKWLQDIRLGDVVKGRNGPAEVLGIWSNTLQERALWDINGVACTPGHLFPVDPEVYGYHWGAASPKHYKDNSHGKKRAVKGRGKVIMTECLLADPDKVIQIVEGTRILNQYGTYEPVTQLAEFKTDDTPEAPRKINNNQRVIALFLKDSDIFYADGYAVATLA